MSTRPIYISSLFSGGIIVLALCVAPAFGQQRGNELIEKLNQANDGILKLHRAGKYLEALPLARSTLELSEQALGHDHPIVATSLSNLALLHKTIGEYTKAEPLLQRALAIQEKALGPEHMDIAKNLEYYADVLRKTDRETEATRMEERAKAIRARPAQ